MRIRHFHPIDLHEDEVVQFLRRYGGVELRDDLADGGRFPGAGHAGDVDAGAGAVDDGGGEMRVDGGEFFLAAGEGGGDGGDM